MLAIPERQERRWKVQKGRDVHLERTKINKTYLRKKLGVIGRRFDDDGRLKAGLRALPQRTIQRSKD